MATCGADRAVKLWEPTHGSHTATLQGSAETVLGVCFTCDARYVLGSGKDIRMWDVRVGWWLVHTLLLSRLQWLAGGWCTRYCCHDCNGWPMVQVDAMLLHGGKQGNHASAHRLRVAVSDMCLRGMLQRWLLWQRVKWTPPELQASQRTVLSRCDLCRVQVTVYGVAV